jgi:hypothetical protein
MSPMPSHTAGGAHRGCRRTGTGSCPGTARNRSVGESRRSLAPSSSDVGIMAPQDPRLRPPCKASPL